MSYKIDKGAVVEEHAGIQLVDRIAGPMPQVVAAVRSRLIRDRPVPNFACQSFVQLNNLPVPYSSHSLHYQRLASCGLGYKTGEEKEWVKL